MISEREEPTFYSSKKIDVNKGERNYIALRVRKK